MTKLDKILSKLPVDVAEHLKSLALEELEIVIVNSSQAIDRTKDELEANSNYQKAKEDLKDLRAGYNEVKKLQGAKIAYALILLEELGK